MVPKAEMVPIRKHNYFFLKILHNGALWYTNGTQRSIFVHKWSITFCTQIVTKRVFMYTNYHQIITQIVIKRLFVDTNCTVETKFIFPQRVHFFQKWRSTKCKNSLMYILVYMPLMCHSIQCVLVYIVHAPNVHPSIYIPQCTS